MRTINNIALMRGFRCLLCFLLLSTTSIATGDNPSMSGEIADVIEAQGPEVAKEWFSEVYPAQKDAFTINTPGMAELASRYMQNGEVEEARAVAWMIDKITQNLLDEAINAGTLPE